MKRWLSLLLAAILLCGVLSGCKADHPTTGPEGDAATEPASETAPSETEPTAPTEPFFFELAELPDIGSYAKTEKTAYFFKDGPHDVFETRDDYGGIVPYFTDVQLYREVPSYSWENPETGETEVNIVEHRTEEYMFRFGFATTDGRIITGGIYDSIYEVQRNPDGSGYYICSKFNEEDTMMTEYQDIIALDGTWRVRTNQWSFSALCDSADPSNAPYFTGEVDGRFQMFSSDGAPVLDLTPYTKKNSYGDYISLEMPYCEKGAVLFKTASEDVFLRDDEFDMEYEAQRATYTLFDGSGTETARFSLDGIDLSFLTKGLLCARDDNSETIQVLDLKGNPVIDKVFVDLLAYDPATKLIIGKCETDDPDQIFTVEYFTENLTPVSPDAGAPDDAFLLMLSDRNLYTYNNCSIISESEITNPVAYNIYGEQIRFDGVDPDEVAFLNLEPDSAENGYLLVETKSGDTALFAPDGTRVLDIAQPDRDVYEEDDEVYYSCSFSGSYFWVSTRDDTSIYYDVETGDEAFRMDKETLLKGTTNTSYYYDWIGTKYLAVTTYEDPGDDYVEDSDYEVSLYSVPDFALVYRNVIWQEQLGDYTLILLSTHSIILDQDGNTVLRIENSDLI